MNTIMVCLFVFQGVTYIQDESPENRKPTFRERVLAEFDTDGDGRLNRTERETLQKAGTPFARKRPGFRRERTQYDAATVKKFDQNGDGKITGEEAAAVRRAWEKRWGELVGEYEAFRDDKPIVENLKRMQKDAKEGKIDDFPLELHRWIEGSLRQADQRNNRPRGHILLPFDRNRDGVLDESELREARKAIAVKNSNPKPESEATSDRATRNDAATHGEN